MIRPVRNVAPRPVNTTPDRLRLPHSARKARHRSAGAVVVEYTVVLLVFVAFMTTVAEFYRISLVDQVLARATHDAAIAAGRDPARCEDAVKSAFTENRVARWLFDRDDSGAIGFAMGSGAAPDGTSLQEIRVAVAADDGSLANGVDFSTPNCGTNGSWIRVHSTVPVRPRFATGTILRWHTSWAVNQR